MAKASKPTTAEATRPGTAVTAPLRTEPAPVVAAKMPAGYKVKKLLTMPLLKFGPNATVYVKFVGAIFKSKPLTNAKGEESKKEPPHLAEVIRLGDDTGTVMHMIIPAVLRSELEGGFKDNGYVGQSFAIKSFEPRKKVTDEASGEVTDPGKSYRTFAIAHLEEETK